MWTFRAVGPQTIVSTAAKEELSVVPFEFHPGDRGVRGLNHPSDKAAKN